MKKAGKLGWLLPVAGLLLLVMAARSMALKVAGRSTQAEVTEVKQVVDSQSSNMDHNYSIAYRFSVEGKTYSGSARRNKVFNITALPQTGGTLSILYLPSLPQINGDTREGPLQALVLGGLGLVLLVIKLKPKKKATSQEGEAKGVEL